MRKLEEFLANFRHHHGNHGDNDSRIVVAAILELRDEVRHSTARIIRALNPKAATTKGIIKLGTPVSQ